MIQKTLIILLCIELQRNVNIFGSKTLTEVRRTLSSIRLRFKPMTSRL